MPVLVMVVVGCHLRTCRWVLVRKEEWDAKQASATGKRFPMYCIGLVTEWEKKHKYKHKANMMTTKLFTSWRWERSIVQSFLALGWSAYFGLMGEQGVCEWKKCLWNSRLSLSLSLSHKQTEVFIAMVTAVCFLRLKWCHATLSPTRLELLAHSVLWHWD